MTAADKEIATRVFVNFAKAIEAYQRQLVSRNAPLDRFVAGNVRALGDDEIRGLKLFVGAADCASCHSGPHLSDGLFHNLGVSQTGRPRPRDRQRPLRRRHAAAGQRAQRRRGVQRRSARADA